MVPNRDIVYLEHIMDEINRINSFIEGVAKEDLVSTDITETHYAIVRSLEIIGEATSKLSASFKERHPEIPWNKVVAMRNKIIHEYMSVDYEVVWETIKSDLPFLKGALEGILRNP